MPIIFFLPVLVIDKVRGPQAQVKCDALVTITIHLRRHLSVTTISTKRDAPSESHRLLDDSVRRPPQPIISGIQAKAEARDTHPSLRLRRTGTTVARRVAIAAGRRRPVLVASAKDVTRPTAIDGDLGNSNLKPFTFATFERNWFGEDADG